MSAHDSVSGPEGAVSVDQGIRTPERATWQAALLAAGVQTGIHYPTPVHLLPAYANVGAAAGQFPESERAATEVLSLPMFPELTADQREQVAAAVVTVAAGYRAT